MAKDGTRTGQTNNNIKEMEVDWAHTEEGKHQYKTPRTGMES